MLVLTTLSLQLLLSSAITNQTNCNLLSPPDDAGETQAHGVILYIYPRSHTIDVSYSGCQNQWFLDDDNYRKLSVVHYNRGVITAYDNINLNGNVGYHCRYENGSLSGKGNSENGSIGAHTNVQLYDRRCPDFLQLKKKTYQSGCYSQSKLNSSDSYDVSMPSCQLK